MSYGDSLLIHTPPLPLWQVTLGKLKEKELELRRSKAHSNPRSEPLHQVQVHLDDEGRPPQAALGQAALDHQHSQSLGSSLQLLWKTPGRHTFHHRGQLLFHHHQVGQEGENGALLHLVGHRRLERIQLLL